MKIKSSDITMASSHELKSSTSVKKASIAVRAEAGDKVKRSVAAIYDGHKGDMVSAMEDYRKSHGNPPEPQQPVPQPDGAQQKPKPDGSCPLAELECSSVSIDFEISEEAELQIKLLNRLLDVINGKKHHADAPRIGGVLDLRGPAAKEAGARYQLFGASSFRFSASSVSMSIAARGEKPGGSGGQGEVGTSPEGTLWARVTATSAEHTESEYTAFRSKGCAVTEDGRAIDFNVEFAMSRSFTAKYDSLTSEEFVMTDPLIINLKGGVASVSDVKFKFDLDADGKEDEVSFAGEGSGFLALDRDGNGKIDDGSELFGAKSGDGFADLAAYDKDGNHWIDENDEIYSKLRVWTKGEDGSGKLLSLKEADVGAIYLGSVSTEFSLKDAATNETNAIIRKSGVYLRESTGAVGTLSHVDLRT